MAGLRDLLAVASSTPLSKHFRSMPSLNSERTRGLPQEFSNLDPFKIVADTGKLEAREKASLPPMKGFPAKSNRALPRHEMSPRRSTLLSRPQLTRSSQEERGTLTSDSTKARLKLEKPQNSPRTRNKTETKASAKPIRSQTWIRYQHVEENRELAKQAGNPFEKYSYPRDVQRPLHRSVGAHKQFIVPRLEDFGLWQEKETMDCREKCLKWLLGLPDKPDLGEGAGISPRTWAK